MKKILFFFFSNKKWVKLAWYIIARNGRLSFKALDLKLLIVSKRLFCLLTIFSRKILLV